MILSYGLGVMAWTVDMHPQLDGGYGLDSGHASTFHNLRVVLGLCAQFCQCEASDQKWGKNQEINGTKWSFAFYTIRLDELIILMWSIVKIG